MSSINHTQKDEKLTVNKMRGLFYKLLARVEEMEKTVGKLAVNLSKSRLMEALCTVCKGNGKIESYVCPKCNGKGI